MRAVKMLYPVNTLDNRELLPSGVELTNDTLESLVSSNKSNISSQKPYLFLQHGSVKSDILDFLCQPPYNVIFSKRKNIEELMDLMNTVSLIKPVIESLDFFREHDFYTYRHVLMVFSLSTLLAKDLIPDYHLQMKEVMTAPNHDFGKICVPLKILKKQTPLTASERRCVEHHAIAGHVLLSYYLKDSSNLAAVVARDHHERRDASGYPRGIRLNSRMVEIISVSDVFDALVSPRPYRPLSYDNRTGLEELIEIAEKKQLSMEIVKTLIGHNRSAKCHHSEVKVSVKRRGTPPDGNLYGVTKE